MINKSKKLSLIFLITLGLLTTGCNSKKAAKEELEQRGIAYNIDSFAEAISSNNNEIIDLFLKAGIDLSSPKILEPIISSNDSVLLEKMLDAGLNPNSKVIVQSPIYNNFETMIRDNNQPLIIALAKKTEMLKILLKAKNIYVNAQDENGDTALIVAMREKLPESVKLLADSNANVEIKNKRGFNAWAAYINTYEHSEGKKEFKMLEMLKAFGDNLKPNIKINNDTNPEFGPYDTFVGFYENYTLLHYAARYDDIDSIQYLIEKKADIKAIGTLSVTEYPDEEKYSVIAPAIHTGLTTNIEIIDLLLKAGTKITKSDLEYAFEREPLNVKLLKRLGATKDDVKKSFAHYRELYASGNIQTTPSVDETYALDNQDTIISSEFK